MNIEQIQKLSDKELRIKVAELCGWDWRDHVEGTGPCWHLGRHFTGLALFREVHRTKESQIDLLPNYPADLNAMHEAENMLKRTGTSSTYAEFQGWLVEVVGEGRDMRCVIRRHLIHATARQRAEALVLTMGDK